MIKKLAVIAIILSIILYLNRAYGYFFDYLDNHQVMTTSEVVAHPYFALPLDSQNTGNNATYLALGDSLTRGVGVDNDQEAYPFYIAEKLSKKQRLEYTDLAVPGSTTADLLKNQVVFLGDGRYQYLSLMIGINDVLTVVSDNQFKANYNNILSQMTARTPNLIVINIPYLASSKIILPPYNFLVDFRTRQFNSIIESLVMERKQAGDNIVYIDLYDQTKSAFTNDQSLYSIDKFHPSAKGYKLWADTINGNLNY